MKKILYIFAAVAAVSCSSGAGETSYAPVAPFTLSVDRLEIESDGKQVATFKITDADGKVLTDDNALMAKIYFKNEATGRRLASQTKTFKSVEDGEFTFSATVSGDACENKVTVVSSGRSKFEVFRKNVAIYRFTATWCSNCPSMTKGFERVNDWTKSRYVELALHGNGSDFTYTGGGASAIADNLIAKYNTGGFPSFLADLDAVSSARAYSEIEDLIFARIADVPATCGIKATSSYSNRKLSIAANLKTSTGGRYDMGFALLRDNCIPGAGAFEDVYHNVVLALSGNYEYLSDKAFNLQKDAESELAVQEVEVDIPEDDKANYFVVVFALKENGEDIDIDNIVRIPVGGSVEYAYN